jgi:hypothetical protein
MIGQTIAQYKIIEIQRNGCEAIRIFPGTTMTRNS